MDGSRIYAAVAVAWVFAIRAFSGTRSLFLNHRQSLWGSLRFQRQESFQTVMEKKEYECQVDTLHLSLRSDSPSETEHSPGRWEQSHC